MQLLTDYVIRQNPASVCPPEIFNNLVALRVPIWTPENVMGEGIVEVHRDAAEDIDALFDFMVAERFPVMQATPIYEYVWNDLRSMLSNNTSAFNYRTYISKSDGLEHLSRHAFGLAIDINPFWNPDVQNGVAYPKEAEYIPLRPGTFTAHSAVTLFLKKRGWIWGGDWENHKDYQHFEKSEKE